MTVVAETPSLRSRRRPSRLRRWGRASVPYLLIFPAIAVITAILGYPLYRLVVLSFQQYGLAELIQRQGTWVGLDNYSSVLRDEIFWRTLLRLLGFPAAGVNEQNRDDHDRRPYSSIAFHINQLLTGLLAHSNLTSLINHLRVHSLIFHSRNEPCIFFSLI